MVINIVQNFENHGGMENYEYITIALYKESLNVNYMCYARFTDL